jgi:thymidylate kinase
MGRMVVELTGSTGVGKSTLAARLLERLAERGVRAIASDQFVCQCYGLRLQWVRWPVVMSVIVDVLTAPWCLLFLLRQPGLCWLLIRIAWRDLESPLFRLNVLRNIAKRLGTHEMLARHRTGDEVVLVDEGLVHQAHSLFVHPSAEPRPDELARFVGEIPMPDLLVLVEGPTCELVERTLRRGHPRLSDGRIAQVRPFIERAQTVLRRVARMAAERTDTTVVLNAGTGEAGRDAALDDLLRALEQERQMFPVSRCEAQA